MMYSWLVGRMIRRGYQQAIGGQPTMLLALAGDDVELVFPGANSFGGTFRGKAALAGWMRRFAALQPTFDISDVIVSGPPWALRVGVRFNDAIGDDYRNQGMEHLLVRRGRLRRVEVFCDTEVISAWERRHPEVATTAPTPA